MSKPKNTILSDWKGLAADLANLHLEWTLDRLGIVLNENGLQKALEHLFRDEKFVEDIMEKSSEGPRIFRLLFKSDNDYNRVIDRMIQHGLIVELTQEELEKDKDYVKPNFMGVVREVRWNKEMYNLAALTDYIKFIDSKGFFPKDFNYHDIPHILRSSFGAEKLHKSTSDRTNFKNTWKNKDEDLVPE
jgi:hypothetical protein